MFKIFGANKYKINYENKTTQKNERLDLGKRLYALLSDFMPAEY